MTTSTGDEIQLIPLGSAYLCGDCNTIGNDSRECHACRSTGLITLAISLGGAGGPRIRLTKARGVVERAGEEFYRPQNRPWTIRLASG
jgi:hypothetical protein